MTHRAVPLAKDPPSDEEFDRSIAALHKRIALAIRNAYRQGGASAVGACSPPGSEEDWCQASRPGAQFTEIWEIFKAWYRVSEQA